MTYILVFGDSIACGAWDSEGGWVSRLGTYLFKKHCVYNLGIPIDETTEKVLMRFKPETKARISLKRGNIIIFEIGLNDSQVVINTRENKTSFERFKRNIKTLIVQSQEFSKQIIFVGLTAVNESKVNPIPWVPDRAYKNKLIKKYNDTIKDICKSEKVYFVDVFEKFAKRGKDNLDRDGVHPNSNGHKIIFETVRDFLIKNKVI
jgi:lysophospholipase L1-like esterase